MSDSEGTVYSTEHGRMCPACGKPKKKCVCRQKKKMDRKDVCVRGKVRVFFDKKGRKGKGMTIVSGLDMNGLELMQLARDLKIKCGVGGTVKDFEIEIQGDKVRIIEDELRKRGIIKGS